MISREWKKSSYSSEQDCLEARLSDAGNVEIRDSKKRTNRTITFTPSEWDAFIAGAKSGQFDIPQS